MKNGFKRMVAVVLTLLLVMQCAPLNAFAEVPGEEDLLEVPVVVSTDTDTDSELAERPMDDEDVEISEEISDLDVPVVLDDSSEEDEEEEVDTEVTVEEPADKNDEEVPVSMFALFALEPQAVPVLKDGSAVIPSGADLDTVKKILADTLISNKDQVDTSSVEWEYYCEGKSGALKNDAWGSIAGFTSQKRIGLITTTYTHPALANNDDGDYQVRIAGTTTAKTLTKKAKNDGSITVNEDCSVAIPYKEDGSADYDALRQKLFETVVASTTPALTYDNVTIEYEATYGLVKSYVPLEGRNLYPAISAGDQKIKFSWAGNDAYYGFEQEVSVTLTERSAANLVLKAGQNVALTYKADGTVDYSALKNAIFAAVFDAESSIPALKAEDVSIEYKNKRLTDLGSKWVPLAGGKVDYVDYDGMTIGDGQEIRVSFSGNANFSAASAETTVNIVEGRSACTIVISDGNLNIRDLSVDDILKAIVTKSDVELTSANASVEYYDEGGLGGYGAGWKALESFSEGTFKIRVVFAGNEAYLSAVSNEAEIRFVTKEDTDIRLNAAPYSVTLPYNEAVEIDFDNLKTAIFQTVVASTDPEVTAADVTFLYYTAPKTGSVGDLGKKWVKLEGEKVNGLTYPAISAGEHQIKFSWAGNDDYYGFEQEVTVTLTDRDQAPYTLNDPIGSVTLVVDDDLNVDYAAVEKAVFRAVIAHSDVLTDENVTIEYYYKGITGLDPKWLPLEGQEILLGQGYPAISAGEQKIRISWAGSKEYAPTVVEATVNVKDLPAVDFILNEDPYEIGLVFADVDSFDYEATAEAIYNAVVASTENPEGLTAADVNIEYNTDKTGVTNSYKDLSETDITGLVKFGAGKWKIRISWPGTKEFKGGSVIVDVTMSDNRLESSVVLAQDASFTYNMDVNVMKQAIFDSVIDWENSALPAKETLTLDDFVILYQASLRDIETGTSLPELPNIPGLPDLGENDMLTQWVPIEGKVYEVAGKVLGQYPQMGAGQQKIRVTFVGNSEYRPSETAEGTVTVNKASVSVKVKTMSMYVDETLPSDFITTNPADKFDIYTISAGITSNVTTAVYLNLPSRYQNPVFLKILDPIVENLYGKSFTQMMNDGITLGELRQLLSTQELLDMLDKLNIDTGTFGQILSAINKLPAITDSVRVSFGFPNRAGMYMVTAVTDNKNYNTGVGTGILVVKMRLTGTKLTWNQTMPGNKLTAAQAAEFDFGATLSYNGDVSIDQSGVHYLYSGVTSKWKSYSSTTTPPTEPGRYVVTVCIIGGNHFASPLTRSFQITK